MRRGRILGFGISIVCLAEFHPLFLAPRTHSSHTYLSSVFFPLHYARTPLSLSLLKPLFRAALLEALESGKNVVMDRYAFSGVAFSSAKPGMSVEWCAEPDAGLPMPDVLLFMELSPERAATRGGFGEERYENPAFQEAVRGAFAALQQRMAGVVGGGEGWWCNVDAWGRVEEVGGRVEAAVAPILKAVASGAVPLRALWDGKELERGGKAIGSQ